MAVATRTEAAVEDIAVSAYTIPTDEPESDGTLEWDSTTIVVVEARAGGETGLGYTYAPAAAGALVDEKLRPVVEGADALAVRRTFRQDIARVELKLGRDPEADPTRLDAAREAIGADTELYVDANGAFQPKQALLWAERYALEWGVTWFEEPVSSANLDGLRFVRERASLDVAAGEYAYVLADFGSLAGCVDCLQADVTRCGGITGLLDVGGLARAHELPVSGHCAPAVSAHALAAVPTLRHLEWFHDHVRIERMLFDGVLEPEHGAIRPDLSRPGHRLELKRVDAERYAVS